MNEVKTEKPQGMSDERFDKLQGAIKQKNSLQEFINDFSKKMDCLEYRKNRIQKIIDVILSDVSDDDVTDKCAHIALEAIIKSSKMDGNMETLAKAISILFGKDGKEATVETH